MGRYGPVCTGRGSAAYTRTEASSTAASGRVQAGFRQGSGRFRHSGRLQAGFHLGWRSALTLDVLLSATFTFPALVWLATQFLARWHSSSTAYTCSIKAESHYISHSRGGVSAVTGHQACSSSATLWGRAGFIGLISIPWTRVLPIPLPPTDEAIRVLPKPTRTPPTPSVSHR